MQIKEGKFKRSPFYRIRFNFKIKANYGGRNLYFYGRFKGAVHTSIWVCIVQFLLLKGLKTGLHRNNEMTAIVSGVDYENIKTTKDFRADTGKDVGKS